jgi:hypothetical protein
LYYSYSCSAPSRALCDAVAGAWYNAQWGRLLSAKKNRQKREKIVRHESHLTRVLRAFLYHARINHRERNNNTTTTQQQLSFSLARFLRRYDDA